MPRPVRLALVALALALPVAGCGTKKTAPKPQRAADPLAFLPAGAELKASANLNATLPGVVFEQVAKHDVPRLAQGDPWRSQGALAQRGRARWIAVQTPDAADVASKTNDPRVGAKDGVLVLAPSAAALKQALSKPDAQARARFESRLARLPSRAPVRVAFTPSLLLDRLAKNLTTKTTWGKAQRDGAAALTLTGTTLRVDVRLQSAPIADDKLPFASGRTAPEVHGSAPLTAAVRGPQRTLALLREAGLAEGIGLLDRVPGFLKPDLSDLGDAATLTTRDRRSFTVRTEPKDPGDWATKLDRLDALSGLFRTLGLADVRIDRAEDGAYTIEDAGRLVLRVRATDDAVVLSTSPTEDLDAVAAAGPAQPVPNAAGALTVRASAQQIRGLVAQALPGLDTSIVRTSDLTGWARAGRTATAAQLQLRVG